MLEARLTGNVCTQQSLDPYFHMGVALGTTMLLLLHS